MSKERARRREAREAQAAERAQARAVEQAALARSRARRAAVRKRIGFLLPGAPAGRQSGALAQRRRTRTRLVVMVLLFAQVVVWIVRPDWQARLGALVVALLAVPVIAAFAL